MLSGNSGNLSAASGNGIAINATAVLESTTDGVMVLDPDWRFLYLNERAKAMIAGGRDLLGQNIWQAFPRPPGGIYETACRRVMAERFPVRCEDFYAPLGIWFENSIYPCGDGIAVYFRDITANTNQARSLRDSEEQSRQQLIELESIYASAPVGLAVLGADLHYLRVNQKLADIHGYPVAAYFGKTLRDMLPTLADMLEPVARRVIESGEPVHDVEVEGETPARPGEHRCWIVQYSPQKDPAGTVIALNVVVEDVTDRKRIERQLRERVEELQAIYDAVPAAVFVAHDPQCRTMTSNRATTELLRLPPGANPSKSAGEAAPRNFRALKDGVELAPEALPVQKAAATGQDVRGYELEIAFDEGDAMHIYGHAAPLFDTSGKPRGAVGAFIDVTDVVEAREAGRRKREKLQHLVKERTADRDRLWQLSTDLMRVVRRDGVILAVNPAWTAVLGWPEEELVGKNVYDLVHPDDRATSMAVVGRLSTEADPRHFEARYRHKDGSYRWISWTAAPASGLVVGVGRDHTAEKAKADALELSAARMRSVFQTTYLYQGLLTPDGILLDANPTSLAGIQASLEDVVGKPFWDTPWFTTTAGMPEMVREAIPLVAAGQTIRQEVVVNLPTGRRAFDFAMRPVFNDKGDVIAIVPEAVELTERREAEEQLRQAQKMEAVGQLSGGIAHDFNNLLAGISGSLELLNARLAQGRIKGLQRYVAAAQDSANRAAVLTHRLLAFSRRQTLDPRPTNTNRLVAGMTELIRRSVGPHITVETVEAPEPWIALVDENQLENALLNLCINARDAMPAGGRLIIETGNQIVDGREFVWLSVSDTGAGMAPDVLARAFDPFFTTKPIGEGTGLGLSMVYGFARQSGGHARIESELAAGTTVHIYLPRHIGADDNLEPTVDAADMQRAEHGEVVLVVDDDPTVRSSIVEALEDLGYTAIEADEGTPALQVLRSDSRIDVLITDVGLPGGMSGMQLADAGRLMRRDLKILFITGYGEEGLLGLRREAAGMSVLSKPFTMKALAGRIKDITSTD